MKTAYRLYSLVVAGIFIGIMSSAKMSYIWGSRAAFFSLSQSIRPLIGLYGGFWGACFYSMIYSIKVLLTGHMVSPLALHLPTFFSALYWAHTSWMIRVGVPVICMILFIAHPIGLQAAFYPLFWLIPLVIFFIPHKSIFLHALASTFIAHAVGSVIWLYWIAMKPELFIGLIPIVIIERCMFATGMTLAYYMCSYIYAKATPYVSRFGFVLPTSKKGTIL